MVPSRMRLGSLGSVIIGNLVQPIPAFCSGSGTLVAFRVDFDLFRAPFCRYYIAG